MVAPGQTVALGVSEDDTVRRRGNGATRTVKRGPVCVECHDRVGDSSRAGVIESDDSMLGSGVADDRALIDTTGRLVHPDGAPSRSYVPGERAARHRERRVAAGERASELPLGRVVDERAVGERMRISGRTGDVNASADQCGVELSCLGMAPDGDNGLCPGGDAAFSDFESFVSFSKQNLSQLI